MIREGIESMTRWYNGKVRAVQMLVLLIFCVAFVLLGWISISYITFDTKAYQQKLPVNIGSPSGKLPQDRSTLK